MALCAYVRPNDHQCLRGYSLPSFGFLQLCRTAVLGYLWVKGLPAVMSAAVSESSGHVPLRGKFEDPTLRSTFAWTSQCPVSLAAGLSFLRVYLKGMPKQSAVDAQSAVFSDTGVSLSWRRPVTTRAAHAWFYRVLKNANFHNGEGTWSVDAATGPDSEAVAATSLRSGEPPWVATGLSDMTSRTSGHPSSPRANDYALDLPVLPASPALKLLRGGDRSLETATRYELVRELGQGTYGTVWAATGLGREFAIKRFLADDIRQAKIDAAEVDDASLVWTYART